VNGAHILDGRSGQAFQPLVIRRARYSGHNPGRCSMDIFVGDPVIGGDDDPAEGLRSLDSFSKGMLPCHSWSPLQPGTGARRWTWTGWAPAPGGTDQASPVRPGARRGGGGSISRPCDGTPCSSASVISSARFRGHAAVRPRGPGQPRWRGGWRLAGTAGVSILMCLYSPGAGSSRMRNAGCRATTTAR